MRSDTGQARDGGQWSLAASVSRATLHRGTTASLGDQERLSGRERRDHHGCQNWVDLSTTRQAPSRCDGDYATADVEDRDPGTNPAVLDGAVLGP
jgi:hypothetical protein